MAPRVDLVASDDALPARTGVVIIGGGIIGTCAAFYLARKGVPVLLCEKGHIAGEQSSRNWGWCRKMGRDPREIPLAVEALRLWGEMNEAVGAETGFRRCGIIYLCKTKEDMAKRLAWLDAARPYQLDTRILTEAEAKEKLPGLTGHWEGALYTASDGRGEPQMAAPTIATAARRYGATVMTQCAVRGIETKGGRVAGVVTEKGRVACDVAVLAGGAWSSLFCGNNGIRLPQLKVLSSVMRTDKLDGGPETSASGGGFGYRKRLDGGYNIGGWSANVFDLTYDAFRFLPDFMPALRTQRQNVRMRVGRKFIEDWQIPRRWSLDEVTPFERVRTLDPEPHQPILDEAHEAITGAFPAFKDARIAERWGGMIDVTPDIVPVISEVDALPGFFIATGFSGHGFGIGPGAGRLVADLVSGEAPAVDPREFRFGRYTDGSRPVPSSLT
jgi:glycine/D-amino acid oxidase-like deaminating enzyme